MNRRRLNWDYRQICPCQRHAGRRRFGRFVRAAADHLQRRAIALVIGIPLAFCALGFPIDAMNVSLPLMDSRIVQPAQSFHIFTTRKTREALMAPETAPKAFTLDIAKEQFFSGEVPFGSIIYREAVRNNLSPELVAAVVEAESDFRPRLVSNKNAQGLMQIVPETGQMLGCGNPFNPSENVAAGAKYLRYLLDRFSGDQRMALAAYNAGEGTVEHYGGIPPFPETLNYLQRVAHGTRSYRQRVQNRYEASTRIHTAFLE
jgi:soluble lytic murein transglycosylase-like protein